MKKYDKKQLPYWFERKLFFYSSVGINNRLTIKFKRDKPKRDIKTINIFFISNRGFSVNRYSPKRDLAAKIRVVKTESINLVFWEKVTKFKITTRTVKKMVEIVSIETLNSKLVDIRK